MLCWLTGENLKAEEKNILLTFIVILIIIIRKNSNVIVRNLQCTYFISSLSWLE